MAFSRRKIAVFKGEATIEARLEQMGKGAEKKSRLNVHKKRGTIQK